LHEDRGSEVRRKPNATCSSQRDDRQRAFAAL
jgi:hypothetical protein